MSENTEISRRALAAFSRGDLDAAIAEVDPEIEWHLGFPMPDLPPDKLVYHGHDEVLLVWRSFRSVWEELTIEVEDILYDVGDILILRARFHGRGAGSGAEVDRVLFYVFNLREGLLLRQRSFDTAAEAFAAAGVDG